MKLNGKLIIAGLTSALICGLVGSITGTFAWYGYSTRATATIAGTTMNAAANLQIGIHDEAFNDNIKGLDDAVDGIFWQPRGGGLRHDAIADYLSKKGYGSDEMRPVSSGNVFEDDGTTRKDISPVEMVTYQSNTNLAAKEADYYVLPLAMRVQDYSVQNEEAYLKGVEIFLSDIEVDLELQEGETHNLSSAFRIDFKEERSDLDKANYTILAPGRDSDGSTKLAGLLDLNQDGFADVVENDYGYKVRHELVYGQYKDGTKVEGAQKDDYDVIANDYEYPVHLDPANHYSEANVIPVTGFEAFEAAYFGKNSMLCKFNASNRKTSTDIPAIATTPNSDDGIVYLTLTAWVEGWDLLDEDDLTASSLNRDSLGMDFHLNLQFQIDRVD